MPDVLTEGLFGVLFLLGVGGMPGWAHGHPNITDYPLWSQTLYAGTHSLVTVALVFALASVLARRPVWIIGAWALHILIDIPTHSIELFPTPFLWPLSEIRVDGIGWDAPLVLGVNAALLIAFFALWLTRARRRGVWPMDAKVNRAGTLP